MSEKDNPNIEELLNSYIDGELSERQCTEVKRLIAHNESVANRLRQLQKCKALLESLPRADGPPELLENIKTSLERKMLLDRSTGQPESRAGARELLLRRVLAAAAMIALVATLALVIFNILSPQGERGASIVAKEPPKIEQNLFDEKDKAILTPAAEKGDVKQAAPSTPAMSQVPITLLALGSRLELKTDEPIAVNAVILKAFYDKGLLDCAAIERQVNKSIYSLKCSRGDIVSLFGDLENSWAKFGEASLTFATEVSGKQITVGNIAAEQVLAIFKQDDAKTRIQIAKDFAALNSIAELLPGKEVLAEVQGREYNFGTAVKPALTSGQRAMTEASSRPEDGEKINLTIVVVGSK